MTTSPDELLDPSADQAPNRDDGDGADDAECGDEDGQVARLRRQLLAERERSLNATDRVVGAEAETAQARAEIKELQYRLHVREAELASALELLAAAPVDDRPLAERAVRAVLRRVGPAGRTVAGRLRTRNR